jgi:hypothetical protein
MKRGKERREEKRRSVEALAFTRRGELSDTEIR